jgi:hypothetical protein
MPLRGTLPKVLSDYQQAKTEPLKGHPFASYITDDTKAEVEAAVGEYRAGLVAEGRERHTAGTIAMQKKSASKRTNFGLSTAVIRPRLVTVGGPKNLAI